MNQKELKELIEFLIEKDIAEFELERGDVKVKIKRAAEPVPSPDSRYFAVHPAPAPILTTMPVPRLRVDLASPLRQPCRLCRKKFFSRCVRRSWGRSTKRRRPGAPPFIKVGDQVEVGQVLCIVEAMKLMNEIECDVAGEVVKKLVTNGQPIEYGQELFAIRPKK